MEKDPSPGREVLPVPERMNGHVASPVDVRRAPEPEPAAPLRPPEGAPNVVVVLVDDMGFGAPSAFGGPCEMQTAERLAGNGLRYSRFHTTALCSPTRQALLTGRNHHAVNMGTICELATPIPGYSSVRPDSAATIAQTLKANGYNTAAFGKMHQTPVWETSPSGPFDRWPTGEGFEKFYGFVAAESDQWNPGALFDGTTPVEKPDDPDYHLSEDLADRAIDYVRRQRAMTPDKPFFLYLPFGATHAPHHVSQKWVEKYRGRFDGGWDRQREETLARQKELGVVPPDANLTARHEEIPAWDDLFEEDRQASARLMETYAGFAEHTDHQVGRLVDALEEDGTLDNTLFLYILGDNGASAEGGIPGCFNEASLFNGAPDTAEVVGEHLDKVGGPLAFNNYPAGWAHAMNAPYQWTKQVASHWGGTRDGLVVHWPGGISARGEVRDQFHHVIDVVPTILEAAGLPRPAFVDGVQQQPVEGVSFAYSFDDARAPDRHVTQYFEMFGNRGIYHEGWTACTKHSTPWIWVPDEKPLDDDVWELYAPDDWTQSEDLAGSNPEKLRELRELFLIEAAKRNVFPLDDRRAERFNSDLAGRPDLLAGRTSITLRPGMTHLNENTVPNLKNKSHEITAEILVPEGAAAGVIVAQGGRFGGWSLYLKGGVPTYCSNWIGRERTYVRAERPLTPGKHTIRFAFAYDGIGVGKGGEGTLYVDGERVARDRIARTTAFQFSLSDLTGVGKDLGTPVTEEYDTPGGRFTGEIVRVRIDAGADVHDDPQGRTRAALAQQ